MSDREEEDIFRRYLRKGYSFWGRIKFRLWLLRTNRKVRTFRDMEFSSDFFMKLVTLILCLMVLRYLGDMMGDIWLWFFPRKVYLPGRWL